MQNSEKPHHHLSSFYIVVILIMTLLLFGCKSEQPTSPPISVETLSPEKQAYFRSGLIELIDDQLTPPVLPDDPVQADLGAEHYYQICLACHGNWGQGLTDEWREIGFGEDMNCWQSKCHAPNHPPQGFEFPREIPPLLGKGVMNGISNAKELYTVIIETMPWWFPESLSEDQALFLTAYLMRARGELPEGIILTKSNLAAFALHYPAEEIIDETQGAIILISGLSLALIAFIWSIKYNDNKDDE